MAHVFSLVFNKILYLLAYMTYSVSAVIDYAAGYKRLKKYNNNNNSGMGCPFLTFIVYLKHTPNPEIHYGGRT